ncbi:MAG: hypothetical protein J6Z02_00935, partial [Lachnospiraceae bacterium]|nr:hypothetical protein [Lachnospiraceae bacterium]
KTLDYDGNRASILNQLAYDMYEMQKANGVTTTPEDMLALLQSKNLTNQQLVSFASYYNNGTNDWNNILTSLINNDSVGINHYGSGVPSDVDINFTGSDVLNWEETEGTEYTTPDKTE